MEPLNALSTIGFVSIIVGALMTFIDSSLSSTPELKAHAPSWLRTGGWRKLPLVLILVGGLSYGVEYLTTIPKRPTICGAMVDYGTNFLVTYRNNDPSSIAPSAGSHIIAAGSKLAYYQSRHFRLMALCFRLSPEIDKLDISDLSKSAAFDIVPDRNVLMIKWNEGLRKAIASNSGQLTDYILLAIPSGLSPEQFATLRQALALGASIIEDRGGPP